LNPSSDEGIASTGQGLAGGSASAAYAEQLTNRYLDCRTLQSRACTALTNLQDIPPANLAATYDKCHTRLLYAVSPPSLTSARPSAQSVRLQGGTDRGVSSCCDPYRGPVADSNALRILNRDEELPSLVARLDLLTEHATPMPIESSTPQSLLGGSTMASPRVVVDQQGTRGYFLFFGLVSIKASGRYRLGVSLTVE